MAIDGHYIIKSRTVKFIIHKSADGTWSEAIGDQVATEYCEYQDLLDQDITGLMGQITLGKPTS